ncbi:MAG: hypothetical protein VB980_04310, partial [Opitutales bacterium]
KTKNMAALQKDVAEASRLDLAKAAIQHPEIGIAHKLSGEYEIRYYSFGDRLDPVSGGGESAEVLGDRTADANSSRIGSAIEEALTRHAGQPLAGIVVLSDFAWIKGSDPIEVARKAKKQGVPIYSVPFGLPSPPDLKLNRIIAPEVAFTEDSVPIRVQVDSSGFDGKTAQVILKIDGEEIGSQTPTLTGKSQFLEFTLEPGASTGSKKLSATIETLFGETTEANNAQSHNIRIINEKIKVLYVEGMPRWEYRYLRWVLKRDSRLKVHFLMTQGDPQLAATSPEHLGSFPTKTEDILKYDLVILGDVRSTYFKKTEQLDALEKLVRESGGSLLMLAGPTGSPNSYADKKKMADMLPVKISGGSWRGVNSNVHPVVTADGFESSVVTLAPNKEQNNRMWSRVRPLGYLPDLNGPKPGATTLLSLSGTGSDAVPYPLVAWQRYGSGKTMYVGTADLWRLRREVGDQLHARFWGQAIQFLALSRVLGQNKQITLETSRKQYATGERIDLFANVLTESFEPVEQSSYSINLEREGSSALPLEIELTPIDNDLQPGLYSGSILAVEEGRFVLSARGNDSTTANLVKFDVENVPVEQRETAMKEDVADQIATLSGGQNLAATQLGALPQLLDTDEKTNPLIIVREKALWDIPIIFLLLVVLTGLEWYLRRRENLV